MKLINIQDSRDSFPCQIFRLPWTLPTSEQIPKFRGLQERCFMSNSQVFSSLQGYLP